MVPFQRPFPPALREFPSGLLGTVLELADDGIVLIFAFKRPGRRVYGCRKINCHQLIAPFIVVRIPILFVAKAFITTLTM